MKSIAYTILPLTFVAFCRIFNTNSITQYRKYLEQNVLNHHYNDISMDE